MGFDLKAREPPGLGASALCVFSAVTANMVWCGCSVGVDRRRVLDREWGTRRSAVGWEVTVTWAQPASRAVKEETDP